MASFPERNEFDVDEQRMRILRAIEEVEKFSAETRKIVAETKYLPLSTVFQGFIAAAALMGAGAAIAKLFFP